MLTETNSISQLIAGVYNHGPDILPWCHTPDDLTNYTNKVFDERLDYPIPGSHSDTTEWLIPEKYKNLDIENLCLSLCTTQEETDRVKTEMDLYKEHNLIIVLQCMKYIVDTLRENNIVWGIGRGSSVASYCLFLLGVHKIDSIRYDIPLSEFFK